jgi:transmembrane sensor
VEHPFKHSNVPLLKLQKLIEKYLSGKTSAAENDMVERWLDNIAAESATDIPYDRKSVIRERIRARVKQRTIPGTTVVKTIYFRPWMRVAAALVPLLVASLYVLSVLDSDITVITGIGEQREIRLPDSSKVWLRPNSSLTYPESFGAQREVKLSGEAFFDVQRNPQKKFIVETNTITVEVLGTSFDVKAYKQLPVATVTVNTGKVKVSNDSKRLGVLLPNHRLEYRRESSEVRIFQSPPADPEGDDGLRFDDVTLREVLVTISNYYPVEFDGKISDDVRLSGSFRNDMTIAQLVDVLNTVIEKHHIKIEKQDDILYTIK